jgi:hypothetical protein
VAVRHFSSKQLNQQQDLSLELFVIQEEGNNKFWEELTTLAFPFAFEYFNMWWKTGELSN